MSKNTPEVKTPTWFNFLSSGLGGIAAWVIIHPFNTGNLNLILSLSIQRFILLLLFSWNSNEFSCSKIWWSSK